MGIPIFVAALLALGEVSSGSYLTTSLTFLIPVYLSQRINKGQRILAFDLLPSKLQAPPALDESPSPCMMHKAIIPWRTCSTKRSRALP